MTRNIIEIDNFFPSQPTLQLCGDAGCEGRDQGEEGGRRGEERGKETDGMRKSP